MHADWLLELRAEPTRRPGHGVGDTEIEEQLAFWAATLRDYGSDFLGGDLPVLDQLERLIRDNARRFGQRVGGQRERPKTAFGRGSSRH